MGSETKFTPGPWYFEGKPHFGECYVRTGQQPEGGQRYICALPTDSKKNAESRAELDANGFLIAAAPDLLEALKEAHATLLRAADVAEANNAPSNAVVFRKQADKARAAIAKATPSLTEAEG